MEVEAIAYSTSWLYFSLVLTSCMVKGSLRLSICTQAPSTTSISRSCGPREKERETKEKRERKRDKERKKVRQKRGDKTDIKRGKGRGRR
jgi:hypothetical protein